MNKYAFLIIPACLLLDSLLSLVWSSLTAAGPDASPKPVIKKGIWIRPVVSQANSWVNALDEVQCELNETARHVPDDGTSRNLLSMPIPVSEATLFQEANRILSLARDENLNPAGPNKITKLLQTMKNETTKGAESGKTPHPWFTWSPGSKRLMKHGKALLTILEEAHRSRQVVMSLIRKTRQDSLDDLTHQVCRASEQLERHAGKARAFDWHIQAKLQEIQVATHVVCEQAQIVQGDLKTLFDNVGTEMQALRALIRQVGEILAELRGKDLLSEMEIDAYESEYFWIGESVMELVEVGWLEV